MADKTLVCKDCGAEFVFTEGEQAFYAEKGLTKLKKLYLRIIGFSLPTERAIFTR